MTNAFTMNDYEKFLDAALAGGYRFPFFDEDNGEEGNLLLRHDIDKNIDMAMRIAEFESQKGIHASYFFLTRSPLYNPLEPETFNKIHSIQQMGHRIGLHCDVNRLKQTAHNQQSSLDELVLEEINILEHMLKIPILRVVSFHNPSKDLVMRKPECDSYISTYDPRFMMPETKYLSDSNANWREGNPCGGLKEMRWKRLHILIHPIWWSMYKPLQPAKILQHVYDNRLMELDRYLRYSNDLWREDREKSKRRYENLTCSI